VRNSYRLAAVLGVAVALLGGLSTVAQAATTTQSEPSAISSREGADLAKVTMSPVIATHVGGGAISAAWTCSTGDMCAWTGLDGTGSRCAWTNADNDWRAGATVCSWASSTNVQSIYNHGTSASYSGVAFYSGANYSGFLFCVPQGWIADISAGGLNIRSHKWISGAC
jgi:hypothetical protein